MAEASDKCDLLFQDTNRREELLKPTNPAAQQALLSSQYKVSPLPSTKVRPKAIVGPRTEVRTLSCRRHVFVPFFTSCSLFVARLRHVYGV